MSDVHCYAPLEDPTKVENQKLFDSIVGLRFLLSLLPDEIEGIKLLK